MSEIASDIQSEVLRLQPSLSERDCKSLVENIPSCFREISADSASHGVEEWHDFFDFSFFKNVAVATIFRSTEIEVFVFAADEKLIHTTEHLALVDVDEFLRTVRGQFCLPDVGLKFPLSQVLQWTEHDG